MMDDKVEVTVDGVSYTVSELSPEAQAQVSNLQFVDTQMAALQAKLAVYQTARNAYQAALQQLLPHTRQ
jgi:riboflavin synthase alpha subunit